jgi:hypothetical protein
VAAALPGGDPQEAAAELRNGPVGPFRFCYRQASSSLTPVMGVGRVSQQDPSPSTGDIYLELDLAGRLLALRVMPPAYGDAQPSSRIDWGTRLDVTRLGSPDAFAQSPPKWWPEAGADVREAREGALAGHRIRIDAAARGDRPIFLRVLLPWNAPPKVRDAPLTAQSWAAKAEAIAVTVAAMGCLVFLAFLARRNLQAGRGDRVGAIRLAATIGIMSAMGAELMAHSHTSAIGMSFLQGIGTGVLACVFYLGVEPAMRRLWPRLLITSTRLLAGQWRDPLVGRAVLAGFLVGMYESPPKTPIIYYLLGRAGGAPTTSTGLVWIDGLGYIAWLPTVVGILLQYTLLWLAILLVGRLIVRRAGAAWVMFAVLYTGWRFLNSRSYRPDAISSWVLLPLVILTGLVWLWLLWRHGALAWFVAFVVMQLAQDAPWTLDLSRWYAWRQWVVVAILLAIAFWGFRNVLGNQSAFPAGALDA